jgi:hypothetical protein
MRRYNRRATQLGAAEAMIRANLARPEPGREKPAAPGIALRG